MINKTAAQSEKEVQAVLEYFDQLTEEGPNSVPCSAVDWFVERLGWRVIEAPHETVLFHRIYSATRNQLFAVSFDPARGVITECRGKFFEEIASAYGASHREMQLAFIIRSSITTDEQASAWASMLADELVKAAECSAKVLKEFSKSSSPTRSRIVAEGRPQSAKAVQELVFALHLVLSSPLKYNHTKS